MRFVLATCLAALLCSSCVSRSKTIPKPIHVSKMMLCGPLELGQPCSQGDDASWIDGKNRSLLSRRIRNEHFPQKGAKELHLTAVFNTATEDSGGFRFKLENVSKIVIKNAELDGTFIAQSLSTIANHQSSITMDMQIPEGLAPGAYSVTFESEKGIPLSGATVGHFKIYPESDIKKEDVKICLELDSHHQCAESLKTLPDGTKEFYVTLNHEKIAPHETVSIRIESSNDLKETQTAPVPVDKKSITEKITLKEPAHKGNMYIELWYEEKNVFKGFFLTKLIFGKEIEVEI